MFVSVFKQLHSFVDNYHHRVSSLRNRYLANSLARRQAIRRSATLALAVCVGLAVATSVHGARRSRQQWGTTRTVAVASKSIPSGTRLSSTDLKLKEVPLFVVPEGALTFDPGDSHLGDRVDGRRARAPLTKGQILTRSVLAGSSGGQIASLIEVGHSAVSVGLSQSRPPLELDDVVDLYGADTPNGLTQGATADLAGTVGRLARSARVVEVGSQHITVIVSNSEIDEVLRAESLSGVAVVITG